MQKDAVSSTEIADYNLKQSNDLDNTVDTEMSADFVMPEINEQTVFGEKEKVSYKIDQFEGPLDLLYTLIKDAKINIEDIFISEITSQYVLIVTSSSATELDIEYAGEFIEMASHLVYLKSARILPHEIEDDVEDDVEVERQALINKIKEFALMKEQSDKLKEFETINKFYKKPVYTDKDYRVSLTNFSLAKLVEAFARVVVNADRHEQQIIPKKVQRDRFSVHDQMKNVLSVLLDKKQILMTDIFDVDYEKIDIITTFLACLELMKFGKITAVQDQIFGDITLTLVDGVVDTKIYIGEEDDAEY